MVHLHSISPPWSVLTWNLKSRATLPYQQSPTDGLKWNSLYICNYIQNTFVHILIHIQSSQYILSIQLIHTYTCHIHANTFTIHGPGSLSLVQDQFQYKPIHTQKHANTQQYKHYIHILVNTHPYTYYIWYIHIHVHTFLMHIYTHGYIHLHTIHV